MLQHVSKSLKGGFQLTPDVMGSEGTEKLEGQIKAQRRVGSGVGKAGGEMGTRLLGAEAR